MRILNSFTERNGTNLILTCAWDSTNTSGPQGGGWKQIQITSLTELERQRLVRPDGQIGSEEFDNSFAVFTYDGLRVGSIRPEQEDRDAFQSGFDEFIVHAEGQDSSISNFRIVELAYEYTS